MYNYDMKKPSIEFFNSLGQYVYKYVDSETNEILYVGKGNGDRCWCHVVEKGFNPYDCYIVARNLEKFEDKKDGPSFCLESFLIATETPDKNSVSGHYKECFTMTSLSSIFGKYQSEQHDMFESMPDWYIANYDIFRNCLREVKLNASTAFFLSNARNKMYMMWWWTPNSEEPLKVTFELNVPEGSDLSDMKTKLKIWLSENGYEDTHSDGKVQKIAIYCDTIGDVIALFKKFMD